MGFLNCGVYRWLNTVTGKSYIGSAVDIETRRKQHLRMLTTGTHHSLKFQHSWNKRGAAAFEFEILSSCLESELLQREQLAIDAFDAYRNGYNMAPIAGSPFKDRKHSAETKLLMSLKGKGRKQSAEWVEHRAATRRGVPLSLKNRQGIEKSWEERRLRPVDPETRRIQTEALIRSNQSDSKKDVVRHTMRKLNSSRTPEFTVWCCRKAMAARLGRVFEDPRPSQCYRKI